MVLTRSQSKKSEDSVVENILNDSISTEQAQITTFRRIKITGDGNCLFRAVSQFLYRHQNQHKELREEAVSYIYTHWR